MTSLLVKEEIAKGVLLLTLNRPEAANALSLQLLQELMEFADEIEAADDVRVIVITGAGERIFCAGADLKERAKMNDREVRRTVSLIRQTIERIAMLKQPTIAAMNGSALGGGLELALACDLRIGSSTGAYGLTETSLAIIPGGGGTQRLPRLVGIGKAKEMIYTAARVTGGEAREIGLIEHVEPRENVITKAKEIAIHIAGNGPIAVKQAKKAIDSGIQVDLNTALSIESFAYEQTIATADRREGLKAFQEKRKPIYKGE